MNPGKNSISKSEYRSQLLISGIILLFLIVITALILFIKPLIPKYQAPVHHLTQEEIDQLFQPQTAPAEMNLPEVIYSDVDTSEYLSHGGFFYVPDVLADLQLHPTIRELLIIEHEKHNLDAYASATIFSKLKNSDYVSISVYSGKRSEDSKQIHAHRYLSWMVFLSEGTWEQYNDNNFLEMQNGMDVYFVLKLAEKSDPKKISEPFRQSSAP